MIKLKLKAGDQVLVIAGKNRGARGAVEKAFPKAGKIVVSGVNIAKHHLKPSRKNPHGGIMDKLAPIDASNAVLLCPHCGKPSRVGYKISDSKTSGKAKVKSRICKKCQESVD